MSICTSVIEVFIQIVLQIINKKKYIELKFFFLYIYYFSDFNLYFNLNFSENQCNFNFMTII